MQRYKEISETKENFEKKDKNSSWLVKTDSYAVTQQHSVNASMMCKSITEVNEKPLQNLS